MSLHDAVTAPIRILPAMLAVVWLAGSALASPRAGKLGADPSTNPPSPHPPGSVPAATVQPAKPSELWSLRPVAHPPLPPVARDGSAHLVDRFLDATMASRGLLPAPAASREAVLRRLTFVLHGLPPTLEETEAFIADTAPDAVERAVDRLLASPRFGERWARHWMDVVRYCESHGSQGDPELPMAWRYRDYLVRAFNGDVPYDQFVREHVAGDLLPSPRTDPVLGLNESALATAHLRMVELGYIPVDALDDQVKAVDNQVDVLSKAFLGLTVSCARCHDHKFDPISQRDFHAWYGILASGRPGQVVVEEPGFASKALAEIQGAKDNIRVGLAEAWKAAAERMPSRWLQRESNDREIAALRREIDGNHAALQTLESQARDAWRKARPIEAQASNTSGADVPAPLARWTFESGLTDDMGSMHGRAEAGASVAQGRLRLKGGDAHVVTAPLPVDLSAMTLEAWVALDDHAQRGGGVLTVQTPDSAVFDSIVFGEREPGRWIAGSDFFRRTRDVGGPIETHKASERVHVAITHGEDGTITLYRDGVPYGGSYRPGPVHRYRAGIDRVVLGRRHLAPGVTAISGDVEEARLHGRALTAAEVAASFKAGFESLPPGALVAAMPAQERTRHEALSAAIARLEGRLASLRSRQPKDDAWDKAIGEAAKDSAHALHPWAVLRGVPPDQMSDAWARMLAGHRAEQAAREAFNRTNFTARWNLRGTGAAAWSMGGPGRSAEASGPGDFIVEPAGDRIVTGLMPGGVLSSTLTRKQPGVLLSPRFKITTDQVSLRALGTHANARVVIENYPIGNGGIYPARGLDRETPGWLRWDTAYRKGSHAYIEVVTSEDFASPGFRSGPRPYADGRAAFAVAEVVMHDRPESPRETSWPWRALATATPPRTADDVAHLLAGHASRCIQRWARREADDEEVAFLDALLRADALPATLAGLPGIEGDVARLRKAESSITVPRRAPGLHEVAGEDFPLFQRGDPNRPGPTVPRGHLSALGGGAYSARGSGRAELARDIASAGNPLLARVMVNRIWHHVFGRGLVATPDNFGRLGVPPTDPELLDALAWRFAQDGGSVRRMVRLLVTSRAFARSAVQGPDAARLDPANDLLSHARVRRLDAESVRDALLATSGQLDLRMGGPGVNVYYTGKTEGGGPPGPLDGDRRRSVYQRVRRNAHHPFLEAFDAPKPSTPRGARDVTNVPAQSLAMLNDPFVREMARRWASTLVVDARPRADRIRAMLASALGRPCDEAEQNAALAHLDEIARGHGLAGVAEADAHVGTWADLAQSIFCLKEFIYVH